MAEHARIKERTKVRKAVIPAAGYGTRMLPITKTVSKEMLPLVDKPIIQQVVEELVEAGIEDIIIVTAAHKADIVDYLGETESGLATHLTNSGKETLLEGLEKVRHLAHFAFVEQHGVYGTGTPVLNAEPYLGDEPFIYTFADDFFVAQAGKQTNSFAQMMEAYQEFGSPVLACIRRGSEEDRKRYGYADGSEIRPGVVDVKQFAEQPAKYGLALESDLASVFGYLVTPEVLPYLHTVQANLPAGKELFFNDSFGLMLQDGKRIIAKEITDADYFDTGNKLEYMKTATTLAASHHEIGDDFKRWLRDFAGRL